MRTLLTLSTAFLALNATHAIAEDKPDGAGTSVSLAVGSIYDSNRLRLQDDALTPVGGSKDDLITKVDATVNIAVKSGLQRAFLEGTAGYSWHKENDFLDNGDVDLTGGLEWGMTSRCSGLLSARFEQRQTDLADLEAIADNTRETSTYLLSSGCNLGADLRAEFETAYTDSTNSTAAQSGDDLEALRYTGRLDYLATENQTYGLRYDWTEIDYVNLGSPNAELMALEATFKSRMGSGLELDAALGYSDGESGSGTLAGEFDGWTGHAEMTYQRSSRFSILSSYTRGLSYSSDISADFFRRSQYQLSTRMEITPVIDGELTARRVERHFFTNEAARPLRRSFDDLDVLRAAVHYEVNRNIRLTSGLELRDLETDGPRGDYDATRYFLTLRVVP